jgi:uncharacterized Zn-binding protein involved in type VI secretion
MNNFAAAAPTSGTNRKVKPACTHKTIRLVATGGSQVFSGGKPLARIGDLAQTAGRRAAVSAVQPYRSRIS